MSLINKASVNFIENGENANEITLNRALHDVIDQINAAGVSVDGSIVDNLSSTSTSSPLSANQGRVLKGLIDNINQILASDDTSLDTLQEIVDYISMNRDTLDSLGISSIAGLQAALDDKSPVGHKHPISDVNGLQTELDGKSDVGHGHSASQISGLGTASSRNVGVSSGSNIPDRGQADARYGRLNANVTFASVTGSSFNVSSDENKKTEITPAPVGLTRHLSGVEFEWKEDGKKDAGVIAQWVESLLPHLVHTNENGEKFVNYNGLVAYLIEDTKALMKANHDLEKRIEAIEKVLKNA